MEELLLDRNIQQLKNCRKGRLSSLFGFATIWEKNGKKMSTENSNYGISSRSSSAAVNNPCSMA